MNSKCNILIAEVGEEGAIRATRVVTGMTEVCVLYFCPSLAVLAVQRSQLSMAYQFWLNHKVQTKDNQHFSLRHCSDHLVYKLF